MLSQAFIKLWFNQNSRLFHVVFSKLIEKQYLDYNFKDDGFNTINTIARLKLNTIHYNKISPKSGKYTPFIYCQYN